MSSWLNMILFKQFKHSLSIKPPSCRTLRWSSKSFSSCSAPDAMLRLVPSLAMLLSERTYSRWDMGSAHNPFPWIINTRKQWNAGHRFFSHFLECWFLGGMGFAKMQSAHHKQSQSLRGSPESFMRRMVENVRLVKRDANLVRSMSKQSLPLQGLPGKWMSDGSGWAVEGSTLKNPPTPLWRWRRAYWGANSYTKCLITFVNTAEFWVILVGFRQGKNGQKWKNTVNSDVLNGFWMPEHWKHCKNQCFGPTLSRKTCKLRRFWRKKM